MTKACVRSVGGGRAHAGFFFIRIASETQRSVADHGELTAQLPDEGDFATGKPPASSRLHWKRDTTERCRTCSPRHAPNPAHASRSWLLTAWSAQWFFPLARFRVNCPPINAWFPGPYCVLLLRYHADEFSLSVPPCAKWKRSEDFTPGKKRAKILGANHWLVVVTQWKPLDPRTLFDTLHC